MNSRVQEILLFLEITENAFKTSKNPARVSRHRIKRWFFDLGEANKATIPKLRPPLDPLQFISQKTKGKGFRKRQGQAKKKQRTTYYSKLTYQNHRIR
ncbi:hypothetical protein SK128_011561 [Halocaridina rubra]|uniref:Uncharacterized protein n=1 Tax=Halocaridina rubra TaxID=373956 RepID=A0AAN8W903_HALRR